MASVQITNLPAAIALNGAEQLEIVQSGTSVRATISQIFAFATGLTPPFTVPLGGTGVTTFTLNGLIYGNGNNALQQVAVGTTGQVLIGNTGAAPSFANATSVAVTSLSFGTTGLTPSAGTQGAITVAGTLVVGNGGTGATTFTSNGVLYGNAAGALQVTAQGAANSILVANGGAPSFSQSPTIQTSVTTPLHIGGTAANSTVTIQSTSGVGTTDSIIFKTGNNGAVTGLTIASNGNATFLSTSTTAIGTLSLTNPLTVANGGTGVNTLASNGVLYGNAAGNILATAQGAANSILVANAGAPSFSQTPSIATSVTVPLVIGGTAAGSSLTIQSTSGAGTTDSILFKVGNNGATTALTLASASTLVKIGAGTATIAPLTLTSGTNMTSSTAGAVEYDGSVSYFSPAALARGVIKAQYALVLGTAYTLTNATGVQKMFNNTANGQITLAAGTYEFECYATISALPATGTFGFALGGTATFTQSWQAEGARAAAGATATGSSSFNTTANTAITPTSATTTAFMWIRGTINVTVGGTLIPQFSMTTTSAAAIIGVGSYFLLNPISGTSGTTNVTIGNWS